MSDLPDTCLISATAVADTGGNDGTPKSFWVSYFPCRVQNWLSVCRIRPWSNPQSAGQCTELLFSGGPCGKHRAHVPGGATKSRPPRHTLRVLPVPHVPVALLPLLLPEASSKVNSGHPVLPSGTVTGDLNCHGAQMSGVGGDRVSARGRRQIEGSDVQRACAASRTITQASSLNSRWLPAQFNIPFNKGGN